MSGMVLSKCHLCVKVLNFEHLILPIIFVNFVNIKQELLHYLQQNAEFCEFWSLCFAM